MSKLLEPDRAGIPSSLRAIPQWVCCIAVPRDNGKVSKVPVSAAPNCAGAPASVDKPATWTDFETAWAFYEKNRGRKLRVAGKFGPLSGVGIVLTRDQGLLGVDLDNAFESDKLKAWAHDLLTKTATCTELSPSGQGLRMFTKGTLPPEAPKRVGNIELYCSGRFLTIPGRLLTGECWMLLEYDTAFVISILGKIRFELFKAGKITLRKWWWATGSNGCRNSRNGLKGGRGSVSAKEGEPMRQFLLNTVAGVLAAVIGGLILNNIGP